MISGIKNNNYMLNQMHQTNHNTQKAAQKVASGKKVNVAADDATAMAISEKMIAAVKAINAKTDNLDSRINYGRIAEGALGGINDTMNDMYVNSLRSMNATMSSADKDILSRNSEALKGTVKQSMNSAVYNEKNTLEDISLNLNFDTEDLDAIKAVTNTVAEKRSSIGAEENGLNHAINVNNVNAENTTAAISRQIDAEMGSAISNLNNQNLIGQAQFSVLHTQYSSADGIVNLLNR